MKRERIEIGTDLKRVSAVFEVPANTNLLFVLWVMNGLIMV